MGDDIAITGMWGHRDIDGKRPAALPAQAVAGDGEGTQVVQATFRGLRDGPGEHLIAVKVQEFHRARDLDGQARPGE